MLDAPLTLYAVRNKKTREVRHKLYRSPASARRAASLAGSLYEAVKVSLCVVSVFRPAEWEPETDRAHRMSTTVF